MKKLIIIILFILMPGICSATDVYLDVSAMGCTGGGKADTNYDPATRSCGSGSSRVYAGNYPFEASTSLSNGDHLYIRAGNYYEDITGKTMPGNDSYGWFDGALHLTQDNVIVENYNGELVWIQCAPNHTVIDSSCTNDPISIWGNGNVVKGNNYNFFVWGSIYFSGTGSILDGIDVSGGWDHQSSLGTDAWPNVIRVEGANVTVQNCKIHDNYNLSTTTNNSNKAMIMHEHDINSVFQNNHFYNPLTGYVNPKYQNTNGTVQTTYRFNWFDRCDKFGIAGTAIYQHKILRFYQNVFIGGEAPYFAVSSQTDQTFQIYNNTFYNVTYPLYSWANGDVNGHMWFNNIIYNDSGSRYGIDFNEVVGSISGEYLDYNDYYATGKGFLSWRHNYKTYSSLSSWQSHTGQEANSITTNPGFLNGSGTFSLPSDFKRTSYPLNGRGGGSWPSVMGAYITGTEIIGLSAGKSSTGKQPSPPQNLR